MPSLPNQKLLSANVKDLELTLQNLCQANNRLASDVSCLAVSKAATIDQMKTLYSLSFRDFAENRVEIALQKQAVLPKDIRWHFIGHIQSKKISKLVGAFDLIHSVDRYEIAQKIARKSNERGIESKILLQVNTSGESSKSGFCPDSLFAFCNDLSALKGVNIQGLMTMAPKTCDQSIIRECFARLRELKERLEILWKCQLPHLSMGMSEDFPIAIEEGATIIRIGRKLLT